MPNDLNNIVEFKGDGKVQISEGQSLLDAALIAGIPIYHICGGNAQCSTCRVLVLEGEEYLSNPNEKEKSLNEQMNFPPHVRLACQTTVINEPVTLQRIIRDNHDIEIYVPDDNSAGQKIGEERELSLFFLDIRNFTSFVETHLAFDVIHIVRKLFLSAQTIIEACGGRIIETMGDGFYAVFGSEQSKEASVNGAIKAGFGILKGLERLDYSYFIPHFNQRFEVGIGVHFGSVISGEIRLGNKNHTVVMGLPVNVAARLQNATKELNNNFIVSADAYKYYSHHSYEYTNTSLILKGIKEPINVFLIGTTYKQPSHP